jgi:hypothetical protein
MRTPPLFGWRAALLLGAALATAAAAAFGCGSPAPPSPFSVGGNIGIGGGAEGGEGGAGGEIDPTLGGPCTKDAQCDDLVDCTFDACDQELWRCRFTPDDSQCQNGIYCDGVERCDLKLGCRLDEPITCSDGVACTINTCDEATKGCLSEPRDLDEDGDPDIHCGGGDCDDTNPYVSSLLPEICNNGIDDDCDGVIDEPACTAPKNDTCLDPLSVTLPGSYALSSAAAQLHYAASCGVGGVGARDVVAAVTIPAGMPVDVQLTARTPEADVALALMGQCGQPNSEIGCSGGGFVHPGSGGVAKVRGRSLGDPGQPLVLPVYVYTAGGSDITLSYELLPASTKPANETCAAAAEIVPATPTLASIVDAAVDVGSACPAGAGDLIYAFTLTQPQNVDLYAVSSDGDGKPALSLRGAGCALPSDEITCNVATVAHIFRHGLAPGTYFVAVSATAPTDVIVTLQLSPPTAPPADEDCVAPPPIPINQTIDVVLAGHQDDVNTGCLAGGVDAVYALDLPVASDVLLLGRRSSGDTVAVELVAPPCEADDGIVCGLGTLSPVRARKRNLPAGSYRVVAESQLGQPMELTALVRPALPPTLVPFANTCGEVQAIPAYGGFFQGNTVNAQPDFDSGCDQGGLPPGGAPDQILALVLPAPKRVVLDMQGSAYATLLGVRGGGACPGSELPMGCAAGYHPERSFLDLELPAGTFYLVVDGYAGQAGPWFLDVHVVDP